MIAKKGGVGKTTLCVLLHESLRHSGQTVAVRDYDSQGSASKSLANFDGVREIPGEIYQVLLIDTPPSLTLPATGAAVMTADIVLIPTSPSPVDLWEADEAARFALQKNPKAKIRIVLNRTKTGTLLTDAAAQSLSGVSASSGVAILNVALGDRQSYQHALLGGWANLDSKAAQELMRLTVAIAALK